MKKAFGLTLLLALASLQPARAGFVFNFDENGVGTFTPDGGTTVALNGTLQNDPSSGLGLVLTYDLSSVGVSVFGGDVNVYEDDAQTIVSDLFRFTDATGSLFTPSADRMIFYSLTGGGAPADTGLPPLATDFGVTEKPDGSFSYSVSDGNGGFNVYNGLSSPVPEPSSLALCALGSVALAGYARRRSARA
jgi:hypothetical protein